MTKKIIFGLGTGRCGTVSLSHLLNEQSNAYFTHERPFLMPWVFENTYAVAKLKQITESPQELTVRCFILLSSVCTIFFREYSNRYGDFLHLSTER